MTTTSDIDGNEVSSIVLDKDKAILGTNYRNYISIVLYAGIDDVTELTSGDKYAKCIWTQVERFAKKHAKKGKEDGSNEDKGQH